MRVFRVEVAPDQETLVHRHSQDYFVVTLGDSKVENHVQGKAPVQLKFADGEVWFTPGNFAHSARNLAATPFRNVTIELKQKGTLPEQVSLGAVTEAAPGVTARVVMVRDGVRVTEWTFAAGAILPQHTHAAGHLVVALSGLELKSIPEQGEARMVRQQAGDVVWVSGNLTHSLVNSGKNIARYLIFEWK